MRPIYQTVWQAEIHPDADKIRLLNYVNILNYFCNFLPVLFAFFQQKNIHNSCEYFLNNLKSHCAPMTFQNQTLWKNLWRVWKSENQKGYIFVPFVRIMYTVSL